MHRDACLVLLVCSQALCGCALSYVGSDDRIHVIGLASLTADEDQGQQAIVGGYLDLRVYGLWLDTAFSAPFLSFGYGRVTAATLRDEWKAPAVEALVRGDCRESTGGVWFVGCALPALDPNGTSGTIIDGAVAGIGIGGGKNLADHDVFRFTFGYSRSVIVAVGADVLICGDPRVDLERWVRRSGPAPDIETGDYCAAA